MTPTEIASIIERVPPLNFVEYDRHGGYEAATPYGEYFIDTYSDWCKWRLRVKDADERIEVDTKSGTAKDIEAAIAACNTHHRAIIAAGLGGKERVE